MKSPGQAAYDSYYAGTAAPRWRKTTAGTKRIWNAVAQAALDAHRANVEPSKPRIVTHGGLEHGDVVVFTGQNDDTRPWVVAKVTWTKGMATLRLVDPKTRKTQESVDYGRVRKINPAHLEQKTEVIVVPDEAPSCTTKGCSA